METLLRFMTEIPVAMDEVGKGRYSFCEIGVASMQAIKCLFASQYFQIQAVGNVTTKVEPLPTSLITSIEPP